ncbi:MAG: tRNA (adenosine(37)-N6)-threonylcarbamoyltransferase complex dimerization subunit type 1 TsaB [Nevskia sp.]|nr:tRNA (adenosine(37)-N6)-threonylcarbamoyltransferase complex dimerization subunit type 1 TsaB [Nevskia sp.]
MKLLAVDTATEACSVALDLDGAVLQRFEVAGREQSARLPQMLQELLAEAGVLPGQLDGLVCGVGPGSFSGVRIGVAYVKGLALGLDRPVLPVSSLAMLAQGAIRRYGVAGVLAALDARMAEVYFCAYAAVDGLAQPLGEAVVAPPSRLGPPVPPGEYAAVGGGWIDHGEALRACLGVVPVPVDGAALPHAADALALARPEIAAGRALAAGELQPLYLRNRVALTQAEQEAARRHRTI